MKRLTLAPEADKILEVEFPDGEIVKYKLKKTTVKTARERHAKYQTAATDDPFAGIVSLMRDVVVNFDAEAFEALPLEYANQIVAEVGKLMSGEVDDPEKKRDSPSAATG